MQQKTVEYLQFATLVIGSWCGIIPIILKIIGNDTKGAFLPLHLPDPASMIVASIVAVAAIVGIFALDKAKPKKTAAERSAA
ncbi:hypothetical protein [Streptomyces sporangiiformans]|uniref:Uncharacterized protein n=1 Tax=Streptomyces sporangiiformans TaxID=2315329 RepID=A0A505DRP3_9ACTN|nr:hypothetical protein [Streptomyces sporangiiformans]TPQ23917.1 hypothetical protein FGD71_001615 [Streptomyces sporangiiformans]